MVDTRFSRFVLIVNGAVPLAFLGWDALHHQLGADPVNYAIHTTGWLALMYLTVSLAVTPLRKLTRLNWLIPFRRSIGVYGFVYAAIHLAIYFWWDRAHDVSKTLSEILGKPFITFGAGALILLTPLALTSTNGMIRLLGPKRWAWLHTLVYPATALAVVHYWLEGKLTTFDKKVFAVSVASLLAFRWIGRFFSSSEKRPAVAPLAVAAPMKPRFWRGQLKIARIFRETPSVQTFRLVPVSGGALPFDYSPGQYLNLSLMIDGKKVPRSYTIASSPTRRDYCELTVKREDLGSASRHLHDTLAEGHILDVSAPAGRFMFNGDGAENIVLIGGGVGITPLMSIARAMTDRCWPGTIDLFFSVRTPAEIIFADEIAALAKRFPNFRPHICVTQATETDWPGLRGRISRELIERFVPDLKERLTFICGPAPMLEPMRELLKSMGVADERIQFEAFVSPSRAGGGDDSSAMGDAMPDAMLVDDGSDAPADGQLRTVTFARSRKSIALKAAETVLDAAENCGVNIEYNCRAGVCGTCKTRLLSGRVSMEAEDALSAADIADGFILACQAHASADVSVDA